MYKLTINSVLIGIVLLSLSLSVAQGQEQKQVTITSEREAILTDTRSTIGDARGHSIRQRVQTEAITSSDSNFDGIKLVVYEQMEFFWDRGTFAGYGVYHHRDGDQSFTKFQGTWKNVFQDKRFVEAPFEGRSEFIGGSGKFENIKGSFAFKGTITPKRATWTGKGEIEY